MDYYVIDRQQTIRFPEMADHAVIRDILNNYTPGLPCNAVYDLKDLTVSVGDAVPPSMAEGDEYAFSIGVNGFAVAGRDYPALMRGFLTMIDKIDCFDKLVYKAPCCKEHGKPAVGFRCVHFCVFPETSLTFLEKCVRTAAVARYTHVILEFWGTVKLDSLPQMAWPFAFPKERIRELIARGRALGLEFIPMLQHLGHAAMARQGASGKHVVLDQAPELAYLYLPGFDGWVWDYEHRTLRKERCHSRHDARILHAPQRNANGCHEAFRKIGIRFQVSGGTFGAVTS